MLSGIVVSVSMLSGIMLSVGKQRVMAENIQTNLDCFIDKD
jgi:hypothetical protein